MTNDFESKNFLLDTKKLNVSEITLAARYPKNGYALNKKSEMVVYVLKGKVVLQIKNEKSNLIKGSVVLIKKNKKYLINRIML